MFDTSVFRSLNELQQNKTDKSDNRVKSSDKQAESSKTKQRWADVDE